MELQDVGQEQKADTSMDNENKQPQMPVEDKSRGYFSDVGVACVMHGDRTQLGVLTSGILYDWGSA